MQGACAGLRVLELSHGLAGPLATMVLADFGAEVIRVESAEGDVGWDAPPHLLLDRGKKSVSLDVRSIAGRAEFRRLILTVDVLVETLGPDQVNDGELGFEALRALNPALVYCCITGFGPTGPLARVKADDALVMARAGIFRDQPGWQQDNGRPVFRASRDGSYFAAMLAVQGILAALRARDRTGAGQLVETSLLQGLACRQNPRIRWLLREGEEIPAESGADEALAGVFALPHHRDPRELNLIGMLVECKDGRWIVHSHTEPHFFPAWIEAIGLDRIWQEERFKGAPYRFPDGEAKAELIQLVRQRMKEQTAAEWMEIYLANGNVCGDVVQTTQEALRHPQVAALGGVVEVQDPRVGPILQIGPLAKIPGAPAAVQSPAPTRGQHTAEVLGAVPSSSFAGSRERASLPAGPLDGLTIVEAAYYYATPFATALLADLGARVIKIEPLRGDPYRALARGVGGGDPVLNLGHNNMARAMQGKESIALNLKDPRGRQILNRLVAKADVFVHSFRRGVPESLGIDEATLRQVNPGLVYQYGASYGSVGPYSRQPAIDPIIAAFAGTTVHQSGAGNPPLTETGADPVAAAGHAAAMMLGLLARDRTGRGQYVESAMILSNLYLNCEDALSYAQKPPRKPVDRRQLGTGATYRLYETAPPGETETSKPYENANPRWVFLAAVEDDEFAEFCAVVGRADIAGDSRFVSRHARADHNADLEQLLEAIFRTRSACEWETRLLNAGVGCVQADAMSHFAFLHRDAQAQAVEMMATSQHPSFGGTYWRHAPLLRFSQTPGRGGTFCELGEHTRTILADLGYDEAAVARLMDDAVVSWPAGEAKVATALS